MAYTGACEYISAYDIVKYDELLRNRIEGREAEVKAAVDAAIRVERNRGVDNLPVGADYPEEYRFLLPPLAPPWFVGARKRVERLSFTPHLTPRTLDRFLEICRKKRFLASGHGPLVLKNPNDFYFNFGEVHRLFPQARMIFIHRHPLHILNSFVAGFGGVVGTRNAYAALIDPRYRDLFHSPIRRKLLQRAFRGEQLPRLVVAGLVRSYRYYLETIRTMPCGAGWHPAPQLVTGACGAEDAYLTIRYEDLCRDPESHLSRIGKWLNIDMQPRIPEKFVEPRNLNVSERVHAAYIERAEEMRPYLEALGYPLFPHLNAPKKNSAGNLEGVGITGRL